MPCVLVDQGTETSVHPKLDYVNSRSMEFFRQLGLVDDVRAAGVAPRHRADVIWSTGLAGEPITTWRLPSVDEERRRIAERNDGTQPAEPGQRVSQPDLGQAGAVKRCRIVVPHALLPGGIHRCLRLLFGDVTEHIAQRGRAEADDATGQLVFDAHVCSCKSVEVEPV